MVDDLEERLGRAAAKRAPMTARIVGGGAFPNVAHAKVLWAGVETSDDEELRRLAVGTRAAAAKAGVSVDGQRFRAHLTLARVRGPVEATNWIRLLDTYRGPVWDLSRIALVESHLGAGPRGTPVYDVVREWQLGRE